MAFLLLHNYTDFIKLDSFKEINNKKIELGYTAMAIFKYMEKKGYEGKYNILEEYCKNKIQNETKKITFF